MYRLRCYFHKFTKKQTKSDSLEFVLGFTEWSLKVLGLWPFKNSFSNTKFCASASIMLTMTFTLFWGIQYSEDGQMFVDYILYIIVSISTTAKLFLVKYHRSNLKVMFMKMKADYSDNRFFNVTTEKFIILNLKLKNYLIYLMALLLNASVVMSGMKVYHLCAGNLTILRDISFIKYLPKLVLIRPIFELVIVCVSGSVFLWAFTVLTLDSTLIALIIHAYNRLQVICENIKMYKDPPSLKYTTRSHSENDCKSINCIVDEHVATLRFIRNIEESFSTFLLIEVLRNSLHIGILINNLIWFYRTGSINPLEPTTILMSVSLHLVSICGSIEYMSNAAHRIGKYAYELKWYAFKATTVQKITFIILRSQVPYHLTAGKYIHLSLETIRNIVAASFTYSSLIMVSRNVLKQNSSLNDNSIKVG